MSSAPPHTSAFCSSASVPRQGCEKSLRVSDLFVTDAVDMPAVAVAGSHVAALWENSRHLSLAKCVHISQFAHLLIRFHQKTPQRNFCRE